jgi:SM-20-related protein
MTWDQPMVERLASSLAGPGWCVVEDFLEARQVATLATACRDDPKARPAAIGRGRGRRLLPDTRGDRIRWLNPEVPAECAVLAHLEALRIGLNRRLFLNLEELEAQFAAYPPGARYARHRDVFRDDTRRVVSLVCYLNREWDTDDGGALRLYLPEGDSVDVAPLGGRLVAFLSADFEHEVLPVRRERLSIAAWLRRR